MKYFGPFTVEATKDSDGGSNIAVSAEIVAADGDHVATVFGNAAHEMTAANYAHFLAASWDMYKLLDDFPLFPATCGHGEESWYCDSCRLEWENAIGGWYKRRTATMAKARRGA